MALQEKQMGVCAHWPTLAKHALQTPAKPALPAPHLLLLHELAPWIARLHSCRLALHDSDRHMTPLHASQQLHHTGPGLGVDLLLLLLSLPSHYHLPRACAHLQLQLHRRRCCLAVGQLRGLRSVLLLMWQGRGQLHALGAGQQHNKAGGGDAVLAAKGQEF
eukprot:1161050-Pelagomonas_calceolata.AAC.12